jgi:hypothetical protein
MFLRIHSLTRHAELVSASRALLPVMPNLFRHLAETLKRVQGDRLWLCVCPFTGHAELVSASHATASSVQLSK